MARNECIGKLKTPVNERTTVLKDNHQESYSEHDRQASQDAEDVAEGCYLRGPTECRGIAAPEGQASLCFGLPHGCGAIQRAGIAGLAEKQSTRLGADSPSMLGSWMLLVRRADSRRCVQAACEWKIMSPGKVVFAPIKRRLPCSRWTPMTPIRRCRLIKTLGAASDTR